MPSENLTRGALLAIEGLLHQVTKAEDEVGRLMTALRRQRQAQADTFKEVQRLRSAIERAHADTQRAIEHPFYSSTPLFAAAQTLYEALVTLDAPAAHRDTAKVCTWTFERGGSARHAGVYLADCGHTVSEAPGLHTCPSCGLPIERSP